jgi:hypothetical protein
VLAVTLIYELHDAVETPPCGDSGWARQNGGTPVGPMNTWDLCFGSTWRAQRPEPLLSLTHP